MKLSSRCEGRVEHFPGEADVERSAFQSGDPPSQDCRIAGELLLLRNLGMHALSGEELLVCSVLVHDVFSKEQ